MHKDNKKWLGGIDDDEDDDSTDTRDLPPHLRKALYKEKRRKESVRFLAMKSPMYDNIEMRDPQGQLLCTISDKKAKWYIRKNLAKWKNQPTGGSSDQKAIILNFEPKSHKSKIEPDLYTTSQKQNICVSCGDANQIYMRHYIVPYSYRTLLPTKYKTHMPHDIVILCPDCNLTCKQYTQRKQREMEASLRHDPETANAVIPNKELHHVKSKALALLKSGDKLPVEIRNQYEALLIEHNKLSTDQELTEAILQKNCEIDTHLPNPKFISGSVLVVGNLKNDEQLIEEFVRNWRKYFVETMLPRFLPKGWTIMNPVHCDC